MSPDGITLAHGIGGAKDLPISPELAIAGAVAALVVSFTVLAIAWRDARATTPRTSGRPAPAWLAGARRLARRSASLLRVLGFAVFLYAALAAVLGKDLLINPVFGMFYVLVVGRAGAALAALRPGVEGDQPGPHDQPRLFAKLSGSDPDRGVFDLPRAARLLAGRGRPVRVRLARAGLPPLTELGPVRLWCAVYVALMLVGGALFGNASTSAPTRSRSTPRLVAQAVDLGPPRRRAASSAARWPTSTPPRSRRAWSAWSRCCSAARRSTRSRTPTRLGEVHPGQRDVDVRCSTTSACSASASASGVIFAVGHHAHRGRRPTAAPAELPDQFAHSVVPIIVGYIIAHYLSYLVEVGQLTLIQPQRPVQQRQQPARHRRPGA